MEFDEQETHITAILSACGEKVRLLERSNHKSGDVTEQSPGCSAGIFQNLIQYASNIVYSRRVLLKLVLGKGYFDIVPPNTGIVPSNPPPILFVVGLVVRLHSQL